MEKKKNIFVIPGKQLIKIKKILFRHKASLQQKTNNPFFICCISLFLLLVLSSCEKVIDIDLNTSSPRIVIEGSISDLPGNCSVRITQTVNFDVSNNFPPVRDAVVRIKDDSLNVWIPLTESVPGLYINDTLRGFSGRKYTLEVHANGENFTAVSTMPELVRINSLSTQTSPFGNDILLNISYNDVPGPNYYRFVETLNGVKQKFIFLADDRLHDGQTISSTLFAEDNDLKTGFIVEVQLQTIDKPVYEYFRSLFLISGQGGGQTATPANPVSNISNGALGYFSAHTERSRIITIH